MSIYSIGAMNQLGDSLENAGFSAEDVTKLKQFRNLQAVKDLLNGIAEIAYLEHIIDCNANPYIPEGWKVEDHKLGGLWKWNPDSPLYLSERQRDDCVEGDDLRAELADKPVLNANVLDYLLAHTELIPESWKGKYVFFWGTIYRNSDGGLFVRDLGWSGSEWRWYFRRLD